MYFYVFIQIPGQKNKNQNKTKPREVKPVKQMNIFVYQNSIL